MCWKMVNCIKDKPYPTINAEDWSKSVDDVYVNVNRDKSLKTHASGESFFRTDPKYGPRKYNTSNKIKSDSQPGKIKDKNHKKEQGKDNDSKTTDITGTENQNWNEAKQPEDENKLLGVAYKLIFKSSPALKTHQTACKSRDISNDSALKLDRNPNTQQQLRKDIEPDGENLDDETFRKEIHDAYTRMSVWRRNVFQVTNGSIGKSFMNELTTNLDLWNNNSPYRNVALKIFMFLPNLSLQRKSHK